MTVRASLGIASPAILGVAIPGVAIAALCCALGGVAFAQDAKPNEKMVQFLPATPGQKGCYARSYDAEHMRQHPKQRVTGMTFLLRAIGVADSGNWVLDPAGKYARVNYQFALSVARRGERALRAAGHCPDGKDALCIRECDGGGVTLEKAADGDALVVRLLDGGIRLGSCVDRKQTWLKPGADDKVFRLEKVAPGECAALEKAEFGN